MPADRPDPPPPLGGRRRRRRRARWPSTPAARWPRPSTHIADAVITTIAPVVAMDGCSVRLLERVEAAVAAGELRLAAADPSRRRRRGRCRLRSIRPSGPRPGGPARPAPGRCPAPTPAGRPGLLVALVAGPEDDHLAVLDHHDGQHGDDVGDLAGPGHHLGGRAERLDAPQVGHGGRQQLDLAGRLRARASLGRTQMVAMVSPSSWRATWPAGAAVTKNRVS